MKLSTTSPVTFRQSTTRPFDPCTSSCLTSAPVQLKGRGGNIAATLNPDAFCSSISLCLVNTLKLQKHHLKQPIEVSNIDGGTPDLDLAAYKCCETITLNGSDSTEIQLLVLPTLRHSLVLGYDFVQARQQQQDLNNSSPIKKQGRSAVVPIAPPRPRHSNAQAIGTPYPASELNSLLDESSTIADMENCLRLVPTMYHNLISVFSRASAESLPAHTEHNLRLDLIPGSELLPEEYRLATAVPTCLRKHLDDLLTKGHIRAGRSAAAAHLLRVPISKTRGPRLDIDYRQLNSRTAKCRYPKPSTVMLKRSSGKGNLFTEIVLRSAYHRLRVAKGDKWKTAFHTPYGTFEYLVMPYELTNAPGAFQRLINIVLEKYLGIFAIAHLDHILVYSDNPTDHIGHVRTVLESVQAHSLYVDPDRSTFGSTQLDYQGFKLGTLTKKETSDSRQRKSDKDQPQDRNQLQQLLPGLTTDLENVKKPRHMSAPLYNLLDKDSDWEGTAACDAAFRGLKSRFTPHPILRHFDQKLPTRLEPIASGSGIAVVLKQQRLEDKAWAPCQIISQALSANEKNYSKSNKVMLATVFACIIWRTSLLSCKHSFSVLSDKTTWKTFILSRSLTRRQAHWAEYLTDYNFRLSYRPGTKNDQADAISRRDNEGFVGEPSSAHQSEQAEEETKTFSQPHHQLRLSTTSTNDTHPLMNDKATTSNTNSDVSISVATSKPENVDIQDGLLLPIPTGQDNGLALNASILHAQLDHTTEDQPNDSRPRPRRRTSTIRIDYDKGCTPPMRSNTPRPQFYGKLRPLPVQDRPWASLPMDSIGPLPVLDGTNSILAAVDHLKEMAIAVPTATTLIAEALAPLFTTHVLSKHGALSDTGSDRGSMTPPLLSSHASPIVQEPPPPPHLTTNGQAEYEIRITSSGPPEDYNQSSGPSPPTGPSSTATTHPTHSPGSSPSLPTRDFFRPEIAQPHLLPTSDSALQSLRSRTCTTTSSPRSASRKPRTSRVQTPRGGQPQRYKIGDKVPSQYSYPETLQSPASSPTNSQDFTGSSRSSTRTPSESSSRPPWAIPTRHSTSPDWNQHQSTRHQSVHSYLPILSSPTMKKDTRYPAYSGRATSAAGCSTASSGRAMKTTIRSASLGTTPRQRATLPTS